MKKNQSLTVELNAMELQTIQGGSDGTETGIYGPDGCLKPSPFPYPLPEEFEPIF
ncbi:hypothetical protein [Salegentibacter mishustinae]|uniref:hypothetical protein n=1 Tax=Salegentibacter mishustinae TaxID=270918 RepID=UPI00249373B4|nr:hypothetical protein [Salegentibacter mishustinae]